MFLDVRNQNSEPAELIERFRRGIRFDIYLDGKKVPHSFYANTETGEVRAYVPGPDGQLRVTTDHETIGEVELKGKVEIKRQPFSGDRGAGVKSLTGKGVEAPAPDGSPANTEAAVKKVYGR